MADRVGSIVVHHGNQVIKRLLFQKQIDLLIGLLLVQQLARRNLDDLDGLTQLSVGLIHETIPYESSIQLIRRHLNLVLTLDLQFSRLCPKLGKLENPH